MEAKKIIYISAAEYMHDYVLRLTFNNGETRIMDFSQIPLKGICAKLRDMDFFRCFTLDPFTVDWNKEIGFAPEYLYEHSILERPCSIAAEPPMTYGK